MTGCIKRFPRASATAFACLCLLTHQFNSTLAADATPRTSGGDTSPACRIFVRFKLVEPAGTTYFVKLGGYIHNPPWYLPAATWPDAADKDAAKRFAAGEFTPWFDLGRHAVAFSVERASPALRAAGFERVVRTSLPLGLYDIIVAEFSE